MNDEFIISRIEGEYAYITECKSGETLFIALALLPLGSDIGTRLIKEGLELKIAD